MQMSDEADQAAITAGPYRFKHEAGEWFFATHRKGWVPVRHKLVSALLDELRAVKPCTTGGERK
jgi:hypothetical protein